MLDSYLKIWLGTAGNATRKTNFESEIILGDTSGKRSVVT